MARSSGLQWAGVRRGRSTGGWQSAKNAREESSATIDCRNCDNRCWHIGRQQQPLSAAKGSFCRYLQRISWTPISSPDQS